MAHGLPLCGLGEAASAGGEPHGPSVPAAVGCSQLCSRSQGISSGKTLSSFQNAMRTVMMGINNRCWGSCYGSRHFFFKSVFCGGPKGLQKHFALKYSRNVSCFFFYSNSFSIYKLIPETCSRAGGVTGWGESKLQPLQLL